MEDEEGLDEREPEKAICAERYHQQLAATATNAASQQLIEEFKHQVIQLKQQEIT